VRGFIDLHSHWIADIDDGARSPAEGIALLRGLYDAGFSTVIATPHMRPGMFENDRTALTRAFESMKPHLDDERTRRPLPEVFLSSEHFFDDTVFQRITSGEALPYPTLRTERDASDERAILIEFPPEHFPMHVQRRFFDLKRKKLTPVLAHPERYAPVWQNDACLDPLLDAGAHLLLDVCALVGKYGRSAQRAAEKLLQEDAYEAACSDAHKPEDCSAVARAIERLEQLVGKEETKRLLADGPRRILDGSK
jgi:protein-tyrosine phosphatase